MKILTKCVAYLTSFAIRHKLFFPDHPFQRALSSHIKAFLIYFSAASENRSLAGAAGATSLSAS